MDLPASFDGQAASFDERAGLRPDVRAAVAKSILELTGNVAGSPRVSVLEVGAGTGEIGAELVAAGASYVGFDLSLPMLAHFGRRIDDDDARQRSTMVQADGESRWPMRDGAANAVFGSRSLHLLDTGHVLAEVGRVLAPGGCLLIGRIDRSGDGAKDVMRRQMRKLLKERGFAGRAGEKHRASLVDGLVDAGASRIDAVNVVSWPVEHTPGGSIQSWQEKRGMGGIRPPEAVKKEILDELRSFAESKFGGLDAVVHSEETYVIEGARLRETRNP